MPNSELRTLVSALEGYRTLIGDEILDAVVRPLRSHLGDDGILRAERRVVTILFADLVGFTRLASQKDPEDVRDLINACFTHLMPSIERYGGTVDKFIGDAMMVLFGAPTTHENDPERAVRAALDLFESINEFNRRYSTNLELHIGINTGLVVAGGLGAAGRQQYTVLGDAVNIASRLMNHATGGEILLGIDTYRAVAPLVVADAVPPISVKGKDEPVAVYRLQGLAEQPGTTRGIAGLHAPMIGRSSELEQLRELLDLLDQGQGSIALITGDAGLGKSRLIREMRSLAANRGIGWLDSRGVEHDATRPYSQISQLMRRSFSIRDNDPIATIHQRLQEGLQGHANLSPLALAVLEMVLTAHTPTSESRLSGELFKRQLHALMQTWWRDQARSQPIVLVFDDLHWADPASSTLMQEMFALTSEVPILFLCAARPDWRELPLEAEALYADRFVNLALQPLTSTASNELVNQLLKVAELPPTLRQRILSKSEGIPFFVEEVVRELIDSGIVQQSNNGENWHANDESAPIELPSNLQGLLMSRIDRLTPQTRQILQQAAVIGRTFNAQVLHHLTPSNGVIHQLETLEAAALIRPLGRNDEYAFRHALTQEAAYQSILLQERRQLHLQIGEALEELYNERRQELAPQLAHHFSIAEERCRAIRYYILAGDHAFSLYAHAEAQAHYQAVLALDEQTGCASMADRIHVYNRLGRTLELRLDYANANQLYLRMIDLGRTSPNDELLLAGLINTAVTRAVPTPYRNIEEARILATEALALARDIEDRLGETRALWVLMLTYDYGADVEQAYAYGQQGLTLARQHNFKEQQAYLLNDLSRSALALYGTSAGLRHYEEAEQYWCELNNLPMLADSLNGSALALYIQGDLDRSLTKSAEAFRVSRRIDNHVGESGARRWRAVVNLERGHFQEAMDQLNHIISTIKVPFLAALNGSDLAWAYAQLGALEEANAILDTTSPGLQVMPKVFSSWPRAIRARVALRSGNIEQAQALIADDGGISNESKLISFGMFLVPIVQMELALLQGNYQSALEDIDRLQEFGEHYQAWLFRTELMLYKGVFLTRTGRFAAAQQALDDAQANLEQRQLLRLAPAIALAQSQVALGLEDHQAVEKWLKQGQAATQHILSNITDERFKASYRQTPIFLALNDEAAVMPWLPY